MPFEIRELVIKASVEEEGKTKAAPAGKMDEGGKQEIIAACVEEVMELLRLKKER
ncbi:MAG: DUF5908 family protein [Bacteroidota bacterium]